MSPPADLRILAPRASLLGLGDPDSLQNVLVDQLPDGAFCFVVDQGRPYVLDKFSMAAVSSPAVIATQRGASAPGRWVGFTSPSASIFSGTLAVNGLAIGSTATLAIAVPSAVAADFAIPNMSGNADDYSVTFHRIFPGSVEFRLRNDSRASTNFDEDITFLLFHA
jgi:hypothetical protein